MQPVNHARANRSELPRHRRSRAYLRGCLTPLVQFKFKLRAGIAELRQELERRARGPSGRRLADACCPSVVEKVPHFATECHHHGQFRDALWDKLHGVSPTAAAVLRGLPAEAQAARLLSDVADSGADAESAAALRLAGDDFVEHLRRQLKGRLHPDRPLRARVLSDAEVAALFAE